MGLIIQSAMKNSLLTSVKDERLPFLIDNLASADPSFGEELYSQSFLIIIIDLIIASSIKDKN